MMRASAGILSPGESTTTSPGTISLELTFTTLPNRITETKLGSSFASASAARSARYSCTNVKIALTTMTAMIKQPRWNIPCPGSRYSPRNASPAAPESITAAHSKIPVKCTRGLLFFAPSRLCVFALLFSNLTQRRRDAKSVTNLNLRVFCVVAHPTDHYGNHWISRQCRKTVTAPSKTLASLEVKYARSSAHAPPITGTRIFLR